MSRADDARRPEDPFDLNRFLTAQDDVYDTVLAELRRGRKQSHWMWYIFPQVRGLGFSSTSQHYGIGSAAEARAYLVHPLLGTRLRECAEILLRVEGRTASEIMGSPDDMKLRSSMTLFVHAADEPQSVFAQVLQKYFGGEHDARTLEILARQA